MKMLYISHVSSLSTCSR